VNAWESGSWSVICCVNAYVESVIYNNQDI
jgi:hypothetical protein